MTDGGFEREKKKKGNKQVEIIQLAMGVAKTDDRYYPSRDLWSRSAPFLASSRSFRSICLGISGAGASS